MGTKIPLLRIYTKKTIKYWQVTTTWTDKDCSMDFWKGDVEKKYHNSLIWFNLILEWNLKFYLRINMNINHQINRFIWWGE